MDSLLTDQMERMLTDLCPPAKIRQIEKGASAKDLWQQFELSGFLDVLLPENQGGAGLFLADIFPLLTAFGRILPPLPLAETMIARSLIATSGKPIPEGAILLATPVRSEAGKYYCQALQFGLLAEYALLDLGASLSLFKLQDATRTSIGVRGSFAADIDWDGETQPVISLPAYEVTIREISAILHAAEMSGAMGLVLEMSIAYVNERKQFGRSLGKFQAIQQQLAVMAEQVIAAETAARMACPPQSILPVPLLAAIAKQCASEAALQVATIAHAVHGAMGISEEYDLQLYTRRLHEWRRASGSESYWAKKLGLALLSRPGVSALDFVRNSVERAG